MAISGTGRVFVPLDMSGLTAARLPQLKGSPGIRTVFSDQLVGNRMGYASLDDAIRAARDLSAEHGTAISIRQALPRSGNPPASKVPHTLYTAEVQVGKSDWSRPFHLAGQHATEGVDRLRFRGIANGMRDDVPLLRPSIPSSRGFVEGDTVLLNPARNQPW